MKGGSYYTGEGDGIELDMAESVVREVAKLIVSCTIHSISGGLTGEHTPHGAV